MKKLVSIAKDFRVNALLCCSAAVLMTACGGGATDAGNGQQTQTAAVSYNSASTGSGAVATSNAPAANATAAEPASAPAADAAPAAPAAPAEAAAPGAGDFGLVGYGANPLSQPADATATAAAPASEASAPADGTPRLLAMAVSVAATPPATSTNYYVSPNGNDGAAGSQAAPFKTLARAAKAATKPGTTVWVAPGTYTGGFKTTGSGTATQRIYWVSTTKWGARIVPPSSSANDSAWDNRGSYVNIVGFEVDGSSSGSGTKWLHGIYTGGSNSMIQENHVHHIATSAACTSAGGSAIGVDSYYHGVLNDVVGNTVHDIGPSGCKYIQGIYVSTSGSVKNNVVYRVGEAAIHLWHDANHVTITNNTVTSSHYGIIVGGGDFYYTSGGDDYTVVNSNIVFGNTFGISEQGKTGTHNSYSNNLVAGNASGNVSLLNGLVAQNTVAADPLFLAYSAGATAPDLKLHAGSPAIARGSAAGAYPTDMDGKPRSAATGYDIGAYQH
jgi:hypothetical protein